MSKIAGFWTSSKIQIAGFWKSAEQAGFWKSAEQRKPTQSKLDTTEGHQRSLQCYRYQGYGHRQSECLTKVSQGKDQKSSTPVDQSN